MCWWKKEPLFLKYCVVFKDNLKCFLKCVVHAWALTQGRKSAKEWKYQKFDRRLVDVHESNSCTWSSWWQRGQCGSPSCCPPCLGQEVHEMWQFAAWLWRRVYLARDECTSQLVVRQNACGGWKHLCQAEELWLAPTGTAPPNKKIAVFREFYFRMLTLKFGALLSFLAHLNQGRQEWWALEYGLVVLLCVLHLCSPLWRERKLTKYNK